MNFRIIKLVGFSCLAVATAACGPSPGSGEGVLRIENHRSATPPSSGSPPAPEGKPGYVTISEFTSLMCAEAGGTAPATSLPASASNGIPPGQHLDIPLKAGCYVITIWGSGPTRGIRHYVVKAGDVFVWTVE